MSSPFIAIEPASIIWHDDLPFSKQYHNYFFTDDETQFSREIFINANHLIKRWSSLSANHTGIFSIGETNFGTGLNFLLTW
ncbi:MAG: bifunctional tRNA (5-methylaminomethyl-2-thiouridine)(34)-methyltransferase MnmD/FAD-dependent 5-carboxymethylaminomethyl-2-thiouridine(34) oxidoreductase MnmC, partial [bacterium]|nr:bifunctional tRNA (5-methylaminomethyl-2-thiouridine)(34)-methyltransferase MnmD/FAD-dependent 5-carboxymethylaminomethyl-2-thiouridine(34) oxidoreductase MnmC [bacterium]